MIIMKYEILLHELEENSKFIRKLCVEIEDNVTLWGQVGVPANRKIGEGVTVLGQSGVLKDLESGKTYFGSPADEARIKYRELALLKKLPTIIENL